jgi:toxin ParE1/3/4
LNVFWSVSALADLAEIREYIAERNPSAAHEIARRILAGKRRLQRFPGLGRPGRVPGTREYIIPRTRFILPYRVQGGTIEILRVFHMSRRWPQEI